jgi:RimJ/RimL family protein N-acetyltransferase
MAVRLAYPDPPLADSGIVLRTWAETDIASVMEGKGFDEREARAWISLASRRQADGAGLSLAISDRERGEAVGMVGLLVRPAPGTVPVAASAGSDRAGLVFQPEPGTVGVGYWVLERARCRGLASEGRVDAFIYARLREQSMFA